MTKKQGITVFVVYCLWIVFALVMWIVALGKYNDPKLMSDGSNMWTAGLYCLIPIAFPVIRFILRAVRGAGNYGARVWDISISDTGRIYASNHRVLYSVIALIIAIALVVAVGIFVLPIYWAYIVFLTIRFGIRVFRS